jgi:hypothetical protein
MRMHKWWAISGGDASTKNKNDVITKNKNDAIPKKKGEVI